MAFQQKYKRCFVAMEIQSLLFPKEHFTLSSSKSWIKKHGYSSSKVDETDNFYRFRQHPPTSFKDDSFRIISIGNSGVKAILACPKYIEKRFTKKYSRDKKDVNEAIREFRKIPKSGRGRKRAKKVYRNLGFR